MKTTFTSLLILLVTCGSISAQRNVFGDRWQINNFGLTTGINMDYHHDMSLQWMADHTANSEVIQLPEEGFDRKDIYGEVAGVTFAGQVGLNRANDTFEGHDSSRELVLSAQVITGREAFISYAYDIPRTNQRMEETIGFCLMDNEFNLGAEYRMVKRKGPLDLHLGAGSFMGSTFNPDMLILRYRGRQFNGEFEPVSYAADAAFYTSDDYQSSTEIYQGNTSQFKNRPALLN